MVIGFSHIKERNAQRIQECIKRGKLKVIFNSNPVEYLEDSVILDANGWRQTLRNDFVWNFAGGEPPTALFKRIGVGIGQRDLTVQGSREANYANQAGNSLLATT